MNNITQFEDALKQRAEQEEVDAPNEEVSLTEEEEQELKELEEETKDGIVIMKSESNGSEAEMALKDYMASVDKNIPLMKSDQTKLISMMQPEALHEYIDNAKENSKSALINIAQVPIGEIELNNVINQTLSAVRNFLNIDKFRRDEVSRKLGKLKPTELFNIMPSVTMKTFISPAMMKTDRGAAKNLLLDIIDYMIASGPENDDFEVYLETQTKLLAVMQEILETNFKVKDILESKESMAEMTDKILKQLDPRTRVYSKYVKSPDSIKVQFTQNSEVNKACANAYRELREKYTNPKELEVIDNEINDAEGKASLYMSVLNLDHINEVFMNFSSEFMRDKRRSKESLTKMAKQNLERIKKANIDAPFPGYTGSETNNNQIYANYIAHMKKLADTYNKFVTKANEQEKEQLEVISDPKIFANVLLIIMGRLQKKLLKEPCTFKEKLEIVISFDLFCRLCTDIFTTERVVKMVEPLCVEIGSMEK